MASPPQLALREQFSTPVQQRVTATFGMWIFLATEALLFAGLFTAYTVYRFMHTAAFTQGSGEMEYTIGAVNTAILICSSLTMVLAVESGEKGKRLRCALFLLSTLAIGAIFLALKFAEYYMHFREHKVPGVLFSEPGPLSGEIQLFYIFYFVMTGLHALHMLIGMGLVSLTLFRISDLSINRTYHTPVDIVGLYWHFIDIVWIFLFAFLYIPGAHLK